MYINIATEILFILREPGNIERLRGFEMVVYVKPNGFDMMMRKQISGDILNTEGRWKLKGRDLWFISIKW